MTKLGIPGIAPALEAELTQGMAKVESLLLSHIQGDYPLVEETSRHLVAAGGKRLRPLLTILASHYGDKNKFGIIESAVVCELTHVATLYHDDVMDEAPLRRGVESANNRWGNTVAILTGDYLFAKVSALLADIGCSVRPGEFCIWPVNPHGLVHCGPHGGWCRRQCERGGQTHAHAT